MKHIITTATLLLALLVTGCVDYSDSTNEISAQIQLTLPDGISGTDIMGSHKVVMTSTDGTRNYEAITNAGGVALFQDIIPDVYNISVSWDLSAAEFHSQTGQELEGATSCTFSGSLNNHLIKKEQTIALTTNMALSQDIIIGKVYYANSKDNNNKNYLTGSYLELYNQSDNAIDVSGLYIGLVESNGDNAFTLEQLEEMHHSEVVLLKQVFRIPANAGKTVAPGGTVLICNSAIDHSLYSPLEHSLKDADFEAKDVNQTYTNNANTPALEAVYLQANTTMSNMNLMRGGPCAVVIFQTDDDVTQWDRTYKYPNTATSGAQWLLLPKKYIIDGVDLMKFNKNGVNPQNKRLYPEIDAGYFTLTNLAGLTGEVVYRKTSSRRGADGHKILEDTNNSSNDFHLSTTIKPREYDE